MGGVCSHLGDQKPGTCPRGSSQCSIFTMRLTRSDPASHGVKWPWRGALMAGIADLWLEVVVPGAALGALASLCQPSQCILKWCDLGARVLCSSGVSYLKSPSLVFCCCNE